jgi:hypothetical protein
MVIMATPFFNESCGSDLPYGEYSQAGIGLHSIQRFFFGSLSFIKWRPP